MRQEGWLLLVGFVTIGCAQGPELVVRGSAGPSERLALDIVPSEDPALGEYLGQAIRRRLEEAGFSVRERAPVRVSVSFAPVQYEPVRFPLFPQERADEVAIRPESFDLTAIVTKAGEPVMEIRDSTRVRNLGFVRPARNNLDVLARRLAAVLKRSLLP